MVNMMRLVAVKTRTGDRLSSPIEVESSSTTTGLGSRGSARFTIKESAIPRGEMDALLGGPSVTFVLTDEDGSIEWAGFGRDCAWDGETLSINASEIGEIVGLRLLNTPGKAMKTRSYQGGSLRDIILQVFRTLFVDGDAAEDLPMVWPAMDLSKKVTRKFEWWRFETAQQVLDTLQAEVGAPVVYFRPEWNSANKLQWRVLVGALGQATHALTVSTPRSTVRTGVTMSLVRDFKSARTGMFVTGNGQEAKIVHGSSRFTGSSPSWLVESPSMVAVSAWGTVEEKSRADAIARGLLAARVDSVEQWKLSVNLDGRWRRTAFVPGDRVEVQHPGDAIIQQGVYQRIIIDVQRDAGETVQLTVQEVPTEVDRLQSGLASVLRRLNAAETQASNRASTTIDEINSAVARAERATNAAQKAADDAKARADAAKKAADKAQSSANSAQSAANSARSRADSAYSSAGSARSAADSAAYSASVARSAASRAQSTANRAQATADKAWNTTMRAVDETNKALKKMFPKNPPIIQY